MYVMLCSFNNTKGRYGSRERAWEDGKTNTVCRGPNCVICAIGAHRLAIMLHGDERHVHLRTSYKEGYLIRQG